LPWEAEWEYAAKYGTPWDWRYWWGDNWDQGRGLITADGDWRRDTTTPPDPKHANPATKKLDTEQQIGLQDLLGNVWEWCQDCYRDGYERVNGDDPGSADAFRSVRGGAFRSNPQYCRSGSRRRYLPAYSYRSIGVRLSRAASD
jgi:formylglycine-generating enzyme required for sulfatase activity